MSLRRFLLMVTAAALVLAACAPSGRPDAATRPNGVPLPPEKGEQKTDGQEAVATPGRSGSVLALAGSIDGPIDLPREIWRFSSGAPVTASPVAAGNTVVAGFADFTLRGLDASDGTELWSLETAAVPVSIAVASSGVYAADLESVSRISIQDGTVDWSLPIQVAAGARIRATATAVYVPTADGRLVAVGVQSGDQLWTVDPDPESETPIVGEIGALDGVLYVCTADGGVAAVTAADGTTRWRSSLTGEFSAGPTVTADGVAVVSADGSIYSLHRESGEGARAGSVGDAVVSSAIVANGSLFVFGATGGVFRLDSGVLSSGTSNASIDPVVRLGSDLAGQPGLLDSRILVTDASGRLRALDASSGQEIWVTTIAARVMGPMAYSNGTMYAAGAEGTVFAVVFDLPPDSAPLLSGSRLWDLPSDGRFRMESRSVEFRHIPDASGVVEWSIGSSSPDDPLVMTIVDARGTVLATNMGKVVLDPSTRAAVTARVEYRVRVERTYPDQQVIVTLASAVIE